jgi:putative aminopeptidase FrvX
MPDPSAVLGIVEDLLELPTAPFVEDLPARFALDRAAGVAGLDAGRDAAGNVVLRAGGRGEGRPPLVLVAHLDHPGFAVEAVEDGRATLEFRGGVPAGVARAGSPLLFFRPGEAEPVGRGRLRVPKEDAGRLRGGTALVDEGDAVEGGFAVWGFPSVRVRPKTIEARACDDLIGVAAVLHALEVAAAAGDGPPVLGLLTRAEEVGLLGALEAARLGTVPRDALVLSLECSRALADAPQGGGVVVRVGDRSTIFDPALTAALAERAASVDGLQWQRKLMDGGVCEASAFAATGWRTSGLAVPLANYHNAADDGGGVAPESVLVEDLLAEVRLLEALVADPLEPAVGPPAWLASRAAAAQAALDGEQA